jgi:hypothetical protein
MSKNGKKKKAAEATPKAPARLSHEALAERYAAREIVPGSLRFETDGPRANKQVVDLVCGNPDCSAVRPVATSDLFQVSFCEAHTDEARKARRKAARTAKREAAKAALEA